MTRLATYLLCAAILATLAGGFGGSLQPARLILAASLPVVFMLSRVGVKISPVARLSLTMAVVMIMGGALSLSWTIDPIGGLGILLAISVGALALYLVSQSDLSFGGVRLLMWAWVAVVGASIPVAFYEIATGNHFQFALEDRVIGGIGEFPFASVLFGNYNDYSAWLCLAFSVTMAAFFETKSIAAKSLIMAINISVIAIIFVNTSRAALMYVGLVFICYLFISNSFRIFSSILLTISAPVMLFKYQGQILDLYEFAIYRFNVVGVVDDSYIQRYGLLENGIRGVVESYGLGIGIGGFDEYINDNYPYFIPNPHNIFLEIGVNFGVIPVIIFAFFLVRIFLIGFSRRDIPQGFRMILMMGALGVPIIGAIPSQAIVYVYWWIWLATLVGIASAVPNQPARVSS